MRWAKVIDQTRCIGCHACTTACKSENEVPLGVHRTYVKYVDVGTLPAGAPRLPGHALQPVRGRRPASPPARPRAMYQRPDGIVDFDKSVCIGCKACIAACPYDAIFINPEDHSAEKCNFCAHRLDVGLEPACVVVCPTEAILVGDLNDADVAGGRRSSTASRSRCAGRRRRRGRSSSTRARTRRRSIRSRRAGPTAGSSCGASRASGAAARSTSGHPGRREQRGRRGARLRRAAPRAVGLAGQPLHVDEGRSRPAPTSCRCCSLLAGVLDAGEPALALGGAASSAGAFLALTGALLDLPTSSTRALLPDLHAAAVAELAGPGRRSSSPATAPSSPLHFARQPRSARRRCRAPLAVAGRAARACSPRSTPRTCSPRRRRATSGRARCCRRTSLVQAVARRRRGARCSSPRSSSPSAVPALAADRRGARRSLHLAARRGRGDDDPRDRARAARRLRR